ncbi:MAG: 3-methyl-2-oxobutanoate hydroxymethyltransferase [Verrucomicrobiales bacterium]|nr:3-methyl-2-oxobutanoate hydroxymethyltransferase [Verrucomicrobiales bacterium]
MSHPSESRTSQIAKRVASLQRPFSSVTAYDYPMGRLADEAGIDVILVGDSVGMMVGGMQDTTGVTLDHMLYHTEIVGRAVKNAILIADLPINTYRTPDESVRNGKKLIECGAHAVKIEGGLRQVEKVRAMVENDIPMVGHLGMLPQRVREEGGYKKKGKTDEECRLLLEAAGALADAGVAMIVLESITTDIATRITENISVPTIGIGSGPNCSGQIRVLHDVIGAYPWFVPPFAKVYINVAGQVSEALQQFRKELK